MKVFKFGGASVKDAEGVRNVAQVLRHFPDEELLVVVSAMGKTTNALEEVHATWLTGGDPSAHVSALRDRLAVVLREVVPGFDEAEAWLLGSFTELEEVLREGPSGDADRDYDRVVSYGELWSTMIVSAYLSEELGQCTWMDARDLVVTDATHRAARVDWEASEAVVHDAFERRPDEGKVEYPVVVQGFIGATAEGDPTTLGREGSDFSAAIFAYLLNAESVTIWKDVPGMFNADPKRFPDTRLLSHISYREAIELSYFGASVIHPRTLQPLRRKHIPLYVRSFAELGAPGSTIDDRSENDSLVPSFILKPKQLLVSISPRDLSFVVEDHLSRIFGLFAERGVRIELMQNSAVAFSVVVDDTVRARDLIERLRQEFEVLYNEGCELLTVRHFDEATLKRLTNDREVLVEQRSRVTARFVLR